MKKFEHIIIEALHTDECLPSEKRTIMRQRLQDYAAFKTLRGMHPSFYRRVQVMIQAHMRRFIAILTMVSVLLVGGGVAFAAEGTLPGDTLYPVKVDIIEPLHTALMFSSAAKASWRITLAQRRINEAAALAAEGKLSTSTAVELSTSFLTNANAAATAVVAQSNKDRGGAAIAAADFSAALGGYAEVLATLGKQHHIAPSATEVLQNAIRIQISTFGSFATATLAVSPADKPHEMSGISVGFLTHLKNIVNHSLDNSEKATAAASSMLDATTSASLRDDLNSAVQTAAHGVALLSQQDDSGALQAFQSSLSATTRLQVLIHAAVVFKLNELDEIGTASASTTTFVIPISHHQTSSGEFKNRVGMNASTTISIPSLPHLLFKGPRNIR